MKDILIDEFKKYKWDVSYAIRQFDTNICIVEFPKIGIKFYYNIAYSSIECLFFNLKNTKNDYYLYEVLDVHNIDITNLLWDYSNASISEYIKQYVKYIHLHLKNVVNGEFGWSKKVSEIRINENFIFDALDEFSNIETVNYSNTDIYKKMKNGNVSWKIDLEKMKGNGTKLNNGD